MKLDSDTIMYTGDKSVSKIYLGSVTVYEKSSDEEEEQTVTYSLVNSALTAGSYTAGTLFGINKNGSSTSLASASPDASDSTLDLGYEAFMRTSDTIIVYYSQDTSELTYSSTYVTLLYEDSSMAIFEFAQDTTIASATNIYSATKN